MDKPQDKIHLSLRPYDKSLEDNLAMYDNMPYLRDATLCNEETIALISGNIVKGYRCNMRDYYKTTEKETVST